MSNTELPGPIEAYIQAANAQDVPAMVACFSNDAVVRDEGRDRRGAAGVRAWAREVGQKYRPMVEPISMESEGGKTILVARVSGSFPGSPIDLRYAFLLEGRKIERLEITP